MHVPKHLLRAYPHMRSAKTIWYGAASIPRHAAVWCSGRFTGIGYDQGSAARFHERVELVYPHG
jgi:hypothetical protein